MGVGGRGKLKTGFSPSPDTGRWGAVLSWSFVWGDGVALALVGVWLGGPQPCVYSAVCMLCRKSLGLIHSGLGGPKGD